MVLFIKMGDFALGGLAWGGLHSDGVALGWVGR